LTPEGPARPYEALRGGDCIAVWRGERNIPPLTLTL